MECPLTNQAQLILMLEKQTPRRPQAEETGLIHLLGQSPKCLNGSSCAILAQGTKNAAQYNTATFRVTKGAELAGAPLAPVDPPPFFSEAGYRLRCTVTDGNGDTATADYIVTVAA